MKSEVIYESLSHQWIVLGRDPNKRGDVVDTNQYVIKADDNAMLIDPGGIEIFPSVLSELTRHVRTKDIKVIFSSHQDPDIASSLAMWLDLCEDLKIYSSWLWTSFISHFCMGRSVEFEAVPDEGCSIQIGSSTVRVDAIPAHYCHSSGNFGIWDSQARILFSGDVGAALLPDASADLYVENFADHIQYMEAFHMRWMPSNSALRSWVKRARSMNPEMICPQHGSIFRGEAVGQFLDWLEALDVESCNPMAIEEEEAVEV